MILNATCHVLPNQRKNVEVFGEIQCMILNHPHQQFLTPFIWDVTRIKHKEILLNTMVIIVQKNSAFKYVIITVLDMLVCKIMDNAIVITIYHNMQEHLILLVIHNALQIQKKYVEE